VPPYYLFLGGLYFFLMPIASNPSLHGDLWYARCMHEWSLPRFHGHGHKLVPNECRHGK
jgi:hypothetical protein